MKVVLTLLVGVLLLLIESGNGQSCPSGTSRSGQYRIHWGSGGNRYYYWCTVCGSYYYCGYRRGDQNVYFNDNTPSGHIVVRVIFREEGAQCWSRSTPWYFNGHHLGSTSNLGCGCRCYSCCRNNWHYSPLRSSGGRYLATSGWRHRSRNTLLINNAQCVSHVTFYTCYQMDSCPLGQYRSGSNCINCAAGRYRSSYSDNTCHQCPAGRYGSTPRMSSSSCSGSCSAGYYCPAGSTSSTANKCPAGRYGTGGSGSSSCSGSCAAGYYCPSASTTATQHACPGGRYSGSGAGSSSDCKTCDAGYYCTSPSSSSREHACGGNQYYCPSGSSRQSVAPSGTYTTGGDSNHRTGYSSCRPGHYCEHGVERQCPAGYYGSTSGLPSSTCSGQCAAGYYCPTGSTSSTQNRCADWNAEPCKSKPEACYCPSGRSSPAFASDGYYTTPENGDPYTRTGLKACPSGYTCEDGKIRSNLKWNTGVCASGFENRNVNEGQSSQSLSPALGVVNNGQFSTQYSIAKVEASQHCANPNPFSITGSGLLKTSSTPFNYEDCPEYKVSVEVSAGRDVLKCEIFVKVLDENEPPQIKECGQREVEEKVPINTFVGKPLEAIDPDLGQALKWEITNSNIFGIGGCSGQIFVADAKLDYTQTQSYDLAIKITDDGTPPASDTCTVRINILDKNDPPVATDKTFSVPESAPGGHVVGNLKATDPDSDNLLYTIVRRDSIDAFTVNGNGDVVVKPDALDFEVKNRYSLTIRVKEDRQKDPLHVDVNVDITVTDANDPPRMAEKATRSVPENSAAGVTVGAPITATDDDAGDEITFSISPPGQFEVDPSSGQITVASNANLNYEATPSIVISVLAKDKAQSTSQTQVTINLIDANEAPFFSAMTRTVSETLAVGMGFDIPIRGNDPDAGQTIFYSFDPPSNKFSVDSVSGQLRVAGSLDYETKSTYTLNVLVQDNGSPSLSGSGTLTINVLDENEPPVVNGQQFSVDENSAKGTNVGTVVATDPEGSSVSYSIADGNQQDAFAIDPSTGKLTVETLAALDFEIYPYFDLKIEAEDDDSNIGSGIVRVVLNDMNEAPVIISDAEPNQNMKRQVPELSPANTPVGSPIRAMDVDKGQKLTFSLTSNSDSHFKIDPVTGQILTAKTLPTITTFGKKTITVRVTDDHPTNPKSTTEPVDVSLTDVNQAPYFDDSSYTRRISESASGGSLVGTPVIAKDDDPGHQATLSYSIISGNVGSVFTIASSTGQISLQSKVDYETLDTYSLLIEVKDNPPDQNGKSVAPMSSLKTYTIEVLDANEAPEISDATFQVPENSNPNTKIGTKMSSLSSDPDNGDVLSYSITGGNPGGLFRIDSTTGQLYVNRVGLNHESTPEYLVKIAATDSGGLSTVCTVRVEVKDVNDPPVLLPISTVRIGEDLAVGSNVGPAFQATDEDGDSVVFEITTGNSNGKFFLDGAQLKLSKALDFETKNSYTLGVKVTDAQGAVDSTTFVVDVWDVNEVPIFQGPSSATVDEHSPTGTTVFSTQATDVDAGDTLRYAISNGNTGDAFSIDTVSGVVKVKNPQTLNYESQQLFKLTISVTDSGNRVASGVVDVNINNINDAPAILTTSLDVPENSPAATVVGTVAVSDEDAGQTHTLTLETNPNNLFVVNGLDIVLAGSQVALDYETQDKYKVKIKIEDDGSPAKSDTKEITINVKDVNEPPSLADAVVSVQENSPVSTTVGAALVATDPDFNQVLNYRIAGGDVHGLFHIDTCSGQITVSKSQLNYEAKKQYVLTVVVQDDGIDPGPPRLSDTAQVTVNIIDVNEAPTVVPATRTIDENSPAGTDLPGGPVPAEDPDNADNEDLQSLSYELLEGGGSDAWAIDKNTGQISVVVPMLLDFETRPIWELTIRVTDDYNPPLYTDVRYTINLRDLNEAPELIAAQLEVRENSPAGTSVGNILGMDQDTGQTVTYSLIGGDDQSQFEVDSNGAVTVANNANLDHETKDVMKIKVRLQDDADTPLHTDYDLDVTIIDVNEAPVVNDATVEINENSPIGSDASPALTSSDVDDGQQLLYSIVSQSHSGVFRIDSVTGVIELRSTNLDFESLSSYDLNIRVTDSGSPPLSDDAKVTVIVKDLNEPPVVPKNQRVRIQENSIVGTYTSDGVKASDPDQGDSISFAITSGNVGNVFKVNPSDGSLTVDRAAIDYETLPLYQLQVTVSDNDGLATKEVIEVEVEDENEPPMFAKSVFSMSVGENAAAGTVVGPAVATDVDAGTVLTWEITNVNPVVGYFAINSASGDIVIDTHVGKMALGSYLIDVTVRDQKGLDDTAQVALEVVDQNEPPVIQVANLTVPENSVVGTVVGTVVATDPDTATKGDILSYAIVDGNHNDAFQINPSSGVVTVKTDLLKTGGSALDFESRPMFALRITVTDDGAGALSDTQIIYVNLIDVPEAPVFVGGLVLSVPENSPHNTPVGTIHTDDVDEADHGKLKVYFVDGNNDQAFAVDADTGAVTVDRPILDTESKGSYSLKAQVVDSFNLKTEQWVTITITDENDRPVVRSATRNVLENAPLGSLLGAPVTGTDQDSKNVLTYTMGKPTCWAANAMSRDSWTWMPWQLPDIASLPSNAKPFRIHFRVRAEVASTSAVIVLSETVQNNVGGARYEVELGASQAPSGVGLVIRSCTQTSSGSCTSLFSDSTPALGDGLELEGTANAGSWRNIWVDLDENTLRVGTENTVLASAGIAPLKAVKFVGMASTRGSVTFASACYESAALTARPYFAVASDGQVSVVQSPNAEHQQYYGFEIVATDDGNGFLQTPGVVMVTVQDVNERPIWTTTRCSGSDFVACFDVNENSDIDVTVGTVTAEEPDTLTSQTVEYAITGGNTGESFKIDSVTGEIFVASTGLDHEGANPVFTLTITATDNGSPSLASIGYVRVNIADVNEAPVLQDSTQEVPENVPINTDVGVPLGGTDVDDPNHPWGTLFYTVVSGSSKFDVDPATGQLYLASGSLDHEDIEEYVMTIRVADAGGLTDDAVITIKVLDVNERPTVFPAEIAIEENSVFPDPVGRPINATDPDEGQQLFFTMTGGDAMGIFRISACSGQVEVASGASLDFETKNSYWALITVFDDGIDPPRLSDTARVNITIIDVNEPPIIQPTSREINENSPVDTLVGDAIPASDPDANDVITYSISYGNDKGIFKIDPVTGQIAVARNALDYEKEDERIWQLGVTVTDAEQLNTTAIVTVTVLDVNEAPVVASSGRSIHEYTPTTPLTVGDVVGAPIIATDPDAGHETQLRFEFVEATELFAIECCGTKRGQITLKSAATAPDVLNHEETPTYTLTVRVTDPGDLYTDATITVSISDVNEDPVFEPQLRSIAEDAGKTTAVGAPLVATDPENDVLTFEIIDGNDQLLWSIDAKTGQLRVDTPALDYETSTRHVITVRVTDSGKPAGNPLHKDAQITVKVLDVNEPPTCPPASASVFTIPENSEAGSIAGRFSASDVDAGDTALLTYDLTGGAGAPKFEVDALTGDITVTSPTPVLDFESDASQLPLEITVTDPGDLSVTCNIVVSLEDVNEPPILDFPDRFITPRRTIALVGDPLSQYTIDPDAADTRHFYRMIFPNNMTRDTLELYSTGDFTYIRVKDDTTLYMQEYPPFEFNVTIEVTDLSGLTTSSVAWIAIGDKNFKPSISSSTLEVDENAPAGTVVGYLQGSDEDVGQKLTYAITTRGANINNPFPFAVRTVAGGIGGDQQGEVYVTGDAPLDFESRWSEYLGAVTVTDDHDEESMSATAPFNIRLRDVQEPPFFDASTFTFHVDENSLGGTVVAATVPATDVDVADAGKLQYRITGDTSNLPFVLDSKTAELTVAGGSNLNYEVKDTYTFTVEVKDTADQTATAEVTVLIDDVNEPPIPSIGELSVDENPAIGTVLGQIQVSDQDTKDTHTFTLMDPLLADYFDIGELNGQVKVAGLKTLDFEDQETWVVPVRVTDSNQNDPLHADINVVVNINDVNDMTLDYVGLAEWIKGEGAMDPEDFPPVVMPTNASHSDGSPYTIILLGSNFGPTKRKLDATQRSVSSVEVTASYGGASRSIFHPSCSILVPNTHIECSVDEGVGANLAWMLTINGWTVNGSDATHVSYRNPSIMEVSVGSGGSDTQAMDTLGGETVALRGYDFGPASAVSQAWYGPNPHNENYDAVCETKGHTLIHCKSMAGVGAGHRWKVRVGLTEVQDLESEWSDATSSYHPPVIASVVPSGLFDTDGGNSVYFTGRYFGTFIYKQAFEVTYGPVVDEEVNLRYRARSCVLKNDSFVECAAAPGVGTQHQWVVTVAEQSSVASPEPGITSYKSPVIRGILDYPSAAITDGGQEFVLHGDQLPGKTDPSGIIPRVWYGPAGVNVQKYQAANCSISNSYTHVTCDTAPGVGFNHSWIIEVDGQYSPVFHAGTGYAPPVILQYFDEGAKDAFTRGDQPVRIEGKNFGPASENAIEMVVYGSAEDEDEFLASDCEVTLDHTEVTCFTGPGAGRELSWIVNIAGQNSTMATTNYHPPQITGFFGPGAIDASSDGGERVVLQGRYFGPGKEDGSSGTHFVDSVRYGYGSRLDYDVTDSCVALSHEAIECVTVPGLGSHMTWQVVVRDQGSERVELGTSYRQPEVLHVEPNGLKTTGNSQRALVPTTGGVAGLIVGRNLGALVEGVSASVVVGNTTVEGVGPKVYPRVLFEQPLGGQGNNGNNGNGNGRFLQSMEGELNRTLQDDGTYVVWRTISKRQTSGQFKSFLQQVQLLHSVSYELPRGEGADVPVSLMLSAKGAVEQSTVFTINYEPPLLAAVSTNESLGFHTLTLYGAFLSPGCVVYVSDKRPVGNKPMHYIKSDGSSPDLSCTFTESQTSMICVLYHHFIRQNGYLHIRDVSGRRSAYREYGTVPPIIAFRSDLVGPVFPTDGSYILSIDGKYKTTVDLSVTIDGKFCQPLPNETHLINVLNTERDITRVPFVPKPGVVENPDGTEGTIHCSIPPGFHGGSVVVFNNDAASDAIQSQYLTPVVSSVSMTGTTSGGKLTIKGSNFGDWDELDAICANSSYLPVANCDQSNDCATTTNNNVDECHAKTRSGVAYSDWVSRPARPLGYVFMNYLGERLVWPNITGLEVTSWSHDEIEVVLPQGEGTGFSIEVMVGLEMNNVEYTYPSSSTVPPELEFSYPGPQVTDLHVFAPNKQPRPNDLAATVGGDYLVIDGRSFSQVYENGEGFVTPTLQFEGPTVSICGFGAGSGFVNCKPCEVVPEETYHESITCITPPGVGKNLNVVVTVKGQSNTHDTINATLSYRPPELHSVTPDHADTGSEELLTLYGMDFGAAGEDVVVHFTRTDTHPNTVVHVPATASNHTWATFKLPLGQGPNNHIKLEVGSQVSNAVGFSYNPPVFEAMVNDFGDDIIRQEVVWEDGHNVTKWVRNVDSSTGKKLYQGDCCISEGGYTVTFLGNSFGIKRRVFFSTPTLPTFDMVRNATSGLPRVGNKTHPSWNECVEKENKAATNPKYHQSLTCEVPQGVGKDLTVWIFVSTGVNKQNNTDPLLFHYDPPEITFTNPLRPDARGEENLEFYGNNFGTLELLRELVPAFHIDIAGKSCLDPAPTFVRGQTVLTCDTQNYTVGAKNVTLTVAYQTSFLSDDYEENKAKGIRTFFEVACTHGYYGVDGEYCSECPVGAICDDEDTYNDPVALPGFFNLFADGSHERCPLENTERPKLIVKHSQDDEGRDITVNATYLCPVVLPCEPPEACLGENLCAPPYKQGSVRCSECADRHYRRSGECVPCPDNPWLLVVFFLVAAIGLGVVGYVMNKKNVHLAFLAIGVDYFQVLAVFANSKVQWPEALRSLFRLLSAFNINIDLAAPECALPNLDYSTKWFFIEALPIAAVALFFVCHVIIWFKTRFIMGQKKDANSHLPLMLGMSILVWFYYYLLATSTSLAVFNCQPTTPDDGNEYLAVSGVTEPCGQPGGLQMRLLPFAIITFSVYSIGFPVAMFIILWKKRQVVLEDQLLRAYGLGNTPQQNPNGYKLRRAMHKLYYLYRGEFYYWRVLVMGRKFCIVACSLLFRKNVVFQLAFIMLVLVISYALQVKYQPFMSLSQRQLVISHHEEMAKDPKSVHARIQTNIAGVLADSRRKKGRKDVWKAGVKKAKNAEFFFDYNTVESTLLFSAIMVTLSGVMFSSGQLERGNWEVQKDLLTAFVIILIAASIVYFAVVFVSEVYVTCCPERAARRQARKAAKNKANPGKQRRASMSPAALMPIDSPKSGTEEAPMAVSSSVNPLMTQSKRFNRDGKDGAESMAESAANSVVKSAALPDSAEWQVVRTAYADLRDQVRDLQKELANIRANSGQGGGMMMYRSNNKRLFDQTLTKSGGSSHPLSPKSSKEQQHLTGNGPAFNAAPPFFAF